MDVGPHFPIWERMADCIFWCCLTDHLLVLELPWMSCFLKWWTGCWGMLRAQSHKTESKIRSNSIASRIFVIRIWSMWCFASVSYCILRVSKIPGDPRYPTYPEGRSHPFKVHKLDLSISASRRFQRWKVITGDTLRIKFHELSTYGYREVWQTLRALVCSENRHGGGSSLHKKGNNM
jgi:hypothetical protein